MDDELERLINTLIESNVCYLCDSPIEIRADDLERESDKFYMADYNCPGCDVGYVIKVKDKDTAISFKAYRKDIEMESDVAQIGSQARKESLQRQSHPASNLVENSMELVDARIILHKNQERLQEAANTIREEGFKKDDEFYKNVKTDLHNYMASAYSFEEIVENVEPKLPTDTSVELAKEQFKEEHQIIKGLRTYAQHHLALPFSLTQFYDENIGQTESTITVSIDDVTDFNYGDPDISYEKVEGNHINIERRVNLHYGAADNLVQEMFGYVQSEHKDELEDFREATTYEDLE